MGDPGIEGFCSADALSHANFQLDPKTGPSNVANLAQRGSETLGDTFVVKRDLVGARRLACPESATAAKETPDLLRPRQNQAVLGPWGNVVVRRKDGH